MTLKELPIGKTATVRTVGGEGALRQHFLDMGIIPGAEVTMVKYAPMGDPVEVDVYKRQTKNSTCAGSNSICHQRALDARKFSVFVEHVCLGRYTDQSSDGIKHIDKQECKHDHEELDVYKRQDVSLTEALGAYLSEKNAGEETMFRAGLCNRLDRNTSGLILAGKTVAATQQLSELIAERAVGKYYLTVVKGTVTETEPVSYTHLDVYKRQARGRSCRTGI